jgi:thymidylate synthase (FAD)
MSPIIPTIIPTNKLLAGPSVFIIGKTTFDQQGVEDFIKHRGMEADSRFPGSPIQNLRDLTALGGDETELMSEFGGRFCYDSFMKGRGSEDYIERILDQRHGSVTEHATYNLAIDGVSRSLSMELIRHRAGFAISQESQRFVDASYINFVVPPMFKHLWQDDLECSEARDYLTRRIGDLDEYRELQAYTVDALAHITDPDMRTMIRKRANEAARSVLPNCAETRMVWTGNLRALRHFCETRGGKHADLEIRRLAAVITETMIIRAPYTFTDFKVIEGEFGVPFTTCEFSKV